MENRFLSTIGIFALVLSITSCNEEKKMPPASLSQSSASPSDTTPNTGYKDTLLTTTVSHDVVAKGLEADGYQLPQVKIVK